MQRSMKSELETCTLLWTVFDEISTVELRVVYAILENNVILTLSTALRTIVDSDD